MIVFIYMTQLLLLGSYLMLNGSLHFISFIAPRVACLIFTCVNYVNVFFLHCGFPYAAVVWSFCYFFSEGSNILQENDEIPLFDWIGNYSVFNSWHIISGNHVRQVRSVINLCERVIEICYCHTILHQDLVKNLPHLYKRITQRQRIIQ